MTEQYFNTSKYHNLPRPHPKGGTSTIHTYNLYLSSIPVSCGYTSTSRTKEQSVTKNFNSHIQRSNCYNKERLPSPHSQVQQTSNKKETKYLHLVTKTKRITTKRSQSRPVGLDKNQSQNHINITLPNVTNKKSLEPNILLDYRLYEHHKHKLNSSTNIVTLLIISSYYWVPIVLGNHKSQQHNFISLYPKNNHTMNTHLTTLINPYRRQSRQTITTNDTQNPQPLLTQVNEPNLKQVPRNNDETGFNNEVYNSDDWIVNNGKSSNTPPTQNTVSTTETKFPNNKYKCFNGYH